jgi:hypothetical protein
VLHAVTAEEKYSLSIVCKIFTRIDYLMDNMEFQRAIIDSTDM